MDHIIPGPLLPAAGVPEYVLRYLPDEQRLYVQFSPHAIRAWDDFEYRSDDVVTIDLPGPCRRILVLSAAGNRSLALRPGASTIRLMRPQMPVLGPSRDGYDRYGI